MHYNNEINRKTNEMILDIEASNEKLYKYI